jgi:hypothetical protein
VVDVLDTVLGRLDTLIAGVSAVVIVVSWLGLSLHRVRRGRPERRYARWFVERYSTYWNPYLDATERLRLDRTYIPLSFVDNRDGAPATATTAIADQAAGNVIVVGDAGSGKTTMLKAYGVSVLGHRRGGATLASVGDDQQAVPFFVPVRILAAGLARGGLAQYLTSEILGAGAGLTNDEARSFLAQLLRRRRCVVLLDGLDEVGRAGYLAICEEVYRFAQDKRPELPTAGARLVITCRHHNFLRIRDDWVSGRGRLVDDAVYALAPLRDTEIVDYLHRLRDRFVRPDGPEYFMAAVRASDALNLHRSPLVLSMSVGLYAGRENFEIPRSIAKLYDTMIEEMLNRHAFSHGDERSPAVNEFSVEDKVLLLRELSVRLAEESGFGPFRRNTMVAVAATLQPATRVEAFVDEVIDRSGLLSPVSDNMYEFAHRSIQEHLIAAELRLLGDEGTRQLRERALDRDWRQVVIFFCAAAHQRVVSPLLTSLARKDPVLAGGCLAGANCLDADALPILDRLADTLRSGAQDQVLPALAALLSATTSPRLTIQDAAKTRIHDSLTAIAAQSDALSALGGDVEAVLGIVTKLIDQVARNPISRTLVSRLVAIVPDDPRLVEPLWRCVTDPSLPRSADVDGGADLTTKADLAMRQFVERLLTLAMDPLCFAELQRQPTAAPTFATPDLRRRVYPFRSGLDPSSNLVTVLCWAEELAVTPPHPNRFLEARSEDRRAWARIEQDRRRRGFSPRLPRPRLSVVSGSPGRALAGVALVMLAAIVAIVVVIDVASSNGALSRPVQIGTLVLAVAEIALALPMVGVRFGVNLTPLHLWQPNAFVDAYDDPRSRHWLLPTAQRPSD